MRIVLIGFTWADCILIRVWRGGLMRSLDLFRVLRIQSMGIRFLLASLVRVRMGGIGGT